MQRIPQRANAHFETEFVAKPFERQVVVLRDGGPQVGLMTLVERNAGGGAGAGDDFAGGLVPADELADPFGTDGVFAAQVGEGHAGLEIGQNATPQVFGIRFHRAPAIKGSPHRFRSHQIAQDLF